MAKPVRGSILRLLAVLCALLAAAGFVAMVLALTVSHTLSAIESAFGSLIIAVLFLALARKTWRLAKTVNENKDSE